MRAANNAGDLVGAVAGFVRAKSFNPAVLTNSWGGDGPFPPSSPNPPAADKALILEIRDAIARGIVVVFSDVVAGRCHPPFNNAAAPGRDLATGFGLVNVSAAAAAI